MDVARMPEPGATEGSSRQDLLRIYEQTKTIAIGADVLLFQPGTTPQKPSNSLPMRSLR